MMATETIKKAIDLNKGDQLGWYGTAKLSVWSVRVRFNTVHVLTNMSTRVQFHVADDVPVVSF